MPESIGVKIFKRVKNKSQDEKKKRTLVLSKENYDQFEKLCRDMSLWPSEIVDEFIKSCLEEKTIIKKIR